MAAYRLINPSFTCTAQEYEAYKRAEKEHGEGNSGKMKLERACYSVAALNKAAEMVKAINWTVKRKNEHFSKFMEIEKVYNFCSENLNRFLFDPDIELKEYRQAAYNYKAHKAEELNRLLRQNYIYITNELNSILTSIRSGEVDYCE